MDFPAGQRGKPEEKFPWLWRKTSRPFSENRVTDSPSLSSYAAQLRAAIQRSSRVGAENTFAESGFNRQALELFRLQNAYNSAYRRLCDSRKVNPNAVANWKSIPAIPVVAFKESELTSIPEEERSRVFHSSGTTKSQPSRHFHHTESLETYEAAILPWFAAHLLPGNKSRQRLPMSRMRIICLTPSPEAVPHSSLAHMLATVIREFGAGNSVFAGIVDADSNWGLAFERVLESLNAAVVDGRPVMMLGTAFNYVHLLDHLKRSGARFHLPEASRIMETGGYKGKSRAVPKSELHQSLSECFGIPASRIVCEYGMSEMSSQAYDLAVRDGRFAGVESGWEHRRFHFPPWARAMIISPETGREVGEGETGLIRVFDLANVWSVMALQTEDLGVRAEEGFELIGRAERTESRGCSLMSE